MSYEEKYDSRKIYLKKAFEIAIKEHHEEVFRLQVERQKKILRWPWYKKYFPYRIKITIIDLRKDLK